MNRVVLKIVPAQLREVSISHNSIATKNTVEPRQARFKHSLSSVLERVKIIYGE